MNSHDSKEVLKHFRESDEFLYLGCTDYLMGWEAFSSRVGFYYEANPEVVFHQELLQVQVLSPTVAVAALTGGSSEAEALFWTEVLSGRGIVGRSLTSMNPGRDARPLPVPIPLPFLGRCPRMCRGRWVEVPAEEVPGILAGRGRVRVF